MAEDRVSSEYEFNHDTPYDSSGYKDHIQYEEVEPRDDYSDWGSLNDSKGTIIASSGDEDEDEDEPGELVIEDMERFEQSFKGITKRYRLINRIGEGMWGFHNVLSWLFPC